MLKKNSNRICSHFAVDFQPHLDARIGEAAQKIHGKFSPEAVTARVPLGYVFRWPADRYVLTLDVRRIGWESLGLAPWADNLAERVDMIRAGLDAIGVREFKRIGFKVSAYLPMSMSHEELCDLMFGSFLAPRQRLSQVFGERADPLLQVQGEQNAFKYLLFLSAMNPQQIAASFRQHSNLENFLEDKFLDTSIKDFQERITSSDCFFFDIDLFQNEVSVDRLDEFAKSSLAEAERTLETCVRCLRSQPFAQEK